MSLSREFIDLIRQGDAKLPEIQQWVTNNPKILHARDDEKSTPLVLISSGRNHVATSQYFLTNGAEVNAADASGMTAALYAASYARTEMLKVFLNANADANQISRSGKNALHYLFSNTSEDSADRVILCLQNLTEYKIDINKRDKNGVTPIMCAAATSPRVFSAFLEYNPDLTLADEDGSTLMLSLFMNFSSEASSYIELLIQRDKTLLLATNKKQQTVVDIALSHPKSNKIEILTKHQYPFTMEQIQKILAAGVTDAIKLQSVKNLDPIIKSIVTTNPKMTALAQALPTCVATNNFKTFTIITNYLCNPEKQNMDVPVDENGNNLLMQAITTKQSQLSLALIPCFAINSRNIKQKSALYLAIQADMFDVAAALIRAGADVNELDETGNPIIASFLSKANQFQFLVDQGAKVDCVLNNRDNDTLLGLAVDGYSLEVVKIIVAELKKKQLQTHVDVPNRKGNTPILIATAKCADNCDHAREKFEALFELNPNLDIEGEWWGHKHTARKLVRYNSDLEKFLNEKFAKLSAAPHATTFSTAKEIPQPKMVSQYKP